MGKELQSRNHLFFINYLKAFAIILVILGHSISFYIQNLNSRAMFLLTLQRFIYAVHVPLFFMVAGFLCHSQNLLLFYKKKLQRLIIPFITFSFLKLFYSNFISNSFMHSNSISLQLVDAFLYGRLYWFIYCMFIIYVLSPILWIHKNSAFIILPILIILNYCNEKYCLWRIDDQTLFQLGRVPIYLVYFVSGFILKKIWIIIENKKTYWVILLLITSVLIFIFFLLSLNNLLPQNYSISLILTYVLMFFFISIALLLPENILILEKYAYYSLQCMFLDSFFKVLFFYLIFIFTKSPFVIFIVAILDSILSLCTSILIDKMPKKLKYIFGL